MTSEADGIAWKVGLPVLGRREEFAGCKPTIGKPAGYCRAGLTAAAAVGLIGNCNAVCGEFVMCGLGI